MTDFLTEAEFFSARRVTLRSWVGRRPRAIWDKLVGERIPNTIEAARPDDVGSYLEAVPEIVQRPRERRPELRPEFGR